MAEVPESADSPDVPPSVEAGRSSAITLRRIVWPILLSLTVLAIIGAFTFRPDEFIAVVRHSNLWLLGAAVLMVIARLYLGGWRLNYISDGRLGRSGGIRGQIAWDFFSNVTPSAIGGAPFAAVYVSRDKDIKMGDATALMIFTILLDQLWYVATIPAVLIASGFMEVIPEELGEVGTTAFITYFVLLLAWVLAFGYMTLYRPDLLRRFVDRVFRFGSLQRFRERVEMEMYLLQERAEVLRAKRPGFYLKGLLLTAGIWLSRYFLLVFVVWGFFGEFDKVLLLFRTAALTLGSLIMPTPGGAGGVEGLYALFVGPLVPDAVLAPSLLIWRFLAYYLFIGLGIFLSSHHMQKTMRKGRRTSREDRTSEEGSPSELHFVRTAAAAPAQGGTG